MNGTRTGNWLENVPHFQPLPWDVKTFDAAALVRFMEFYYPDSSNRERATIMGVTEGAHRKLLKREQGLTLDTYRRVLWELDQTFGAFLRGIWGGSGGFVYRGLECAQKCARRKVQS